MAAYVQESGLVSFFIYSPDLGRKEGTVSKLGLVITDRVSCLAL